MSDGVTDLLDVLLFSILAILLAGVGFVVAVEGWAPVVRKPQN